ncbi:hypothetical protein MMC30_006078 [Trapelia coarctata]|nr:hypothetical protein [Trapelia coarctata]
MRVPSLQLLCAFRAAELSMPACPIQWGVLNIRNTIRPGLPGRIDRPALRARLSSSAIARQSALGKSSDRGPASKEDTQTDFGTLNVLGDTPPPTTSIDACLTDGFHLDNGLKIGRGSGCILLAGQAFSWRPWESAGKAGRSRLLNTKGQWAVENEAWGVLDLVWPKPGMEVLFILSSKVHPAPGRFYFQQGNYHFED